MDKCVVLDMTKFKPVQSKMILSWFELWLKRHCKSEWNIKVEDDPDDHHTIMKVEFADSREAIYFRLSADFSQCHSQMLNNWLLTDKVAI
jgi:hypothetical protein